jgi:tRNA(Ile)-lysidine synthase
MMQRHPLLRHLQKSGMPLALGFSGGADSTYLLAQLLLGQSTGRLLVINIDHRAGGISGEEAKQAFNNTMVNRRRSTSPPLKREVEYLGVALPEWQKQPSENDLRQARYNKFFSVLAEQKIWRLALAHTENDQAETLLHRLLRGTGAQGLAGIPWGSERDDFMLYRPILNHSRADIEAWLRREDYTWIDDPTNAERGPLRNRLRHELLPHLRDEYQPQIIPQLANLAADFADERDWWDAHLNRLIAGEPRWPEALRLNHLLESHPVEQKKLLHRWLTEATKDDNKQVERVHVESLLSWLQKKHCTHYHATLTIWQDFNIYKSRNWVQLNSSPE